MIRSEKPAASIGMPVYNGEKYIGEALDSLLAQTFSDFELIISDNASTDMTQAICEAYTLRDSRIRYLRQDVNQGALANFQFVLNQAEAEFFMWAAADDRWDENWLESIMTCAKAKKNVACFGQLAHIDAQTHFLSHSANGAKLQFIGPSWWRKLDFYLAYEGQGKANLFYALYPRTVLQQVDLCGQQADYQILFCLLDRVSYLQVTNTHLYKRVHAESDGEAKSVLADQSIWAGTGIAIARYLKMIKHYQHGTRFWWRVILAVAVPIKLLVALKFYLSKSK